MRISLTYLSLLFTISLFAQKSQIDSLRSLLKIDKEDTNKVMHLNSLSREYLNTGHYDTALHYANSALALGKQLNFKREIAQSSNNIGLIYFRQGNYSKALENHFYALKIREAIANKRGIAGSYNNIGMVYQQQGNNQKSLDYFLRALKINEEVGNQKWSLINLGNIGVIYGSQGNFPKSLEYLFKAQKISEELGDKNQLAIQLGNIGNVYREEGDYPQALNYYIRSLKIHEELGDKGGIAIECGNIGALYTKETKYKEAEIYLLKSVKLSEEIGDLYGAMEINKYLCELYEKTNRLADALKYHKKYSSGKDSVFNAESSEKIARLQFNYEQEKRDKIRELEEKVKEQQHASEVKQQRIITYSVSGGLFLVLLLSLFIFRGYRQKQKANKELAEKNTLIEKSKHIIEEKNKDITDSINYARRIQRAMLPHRRDIWTAFPQSFVLYKPKDIVSGDFYFFHPGKTPFIAAADCTGHGVPGAFMSMVGAGKLNDAVAESSDTSEVLALLNVGVKTALKQSEEDQSATRDGMDIALCSVDTVNKVVKYAGANRPIWIIRKGSTAVEEIKATKKAIGGFTENSQHFDTHEIKLNEGDSFYLSTDGYADTFGKDGKKMMTKRFKEILLGIQDKTMKEQEKYLDTFVEDWKAGTEQVDDILVIGIRL
jgi:serine phosphatase RsbU (regulator of sigma subunit)/Tfp pilus assembly protein PilF